MLGYKRRYTGSPYKFRCYFLKVTSLEKKMEAVQGSRDAAFYYFNRDDILPTSQQIIYFGIAGMGFTMPVEE